MEVDAKTCSQFGTVVNKASLRELQEVEDGCNQQPAMVENSTRAEELEVFQSFKNGVVNTNTEGKVGNSESDSFLESPSLAIKASEEIPKAFKDSEDKVKPILTKTQELENESQMQQDQTNETLEATGDIIKGDKIDSCGKQTLTEMILDNARADDVGLVSSSELSTVRNDEENIGEKLPAVPITSVSDDLNVQEGKTEGGNGAVMDDMKRKNDVAFDDKQGPVVEHLQSGDIIHHQFVGNSKAVYDDRLTEGVCASQSNEEDRAVTISDKDETEGKESVEDPDLKSGEEENVVNNMEVESSNKEEIAADDLDTHDISIKEEVKHSDFQEEELECKEQSSNFVGMVKDPETISQKEERDYGNKEGVEMVTEETGLQKYNVEESWSPNNTSTHLLDETNLKPIDSQKERNDENATEPEIRDKKIMDIIGRVDIEVAEVSEQLEKDKPELEQNDRKELPPEMKHEDLDFETNDARDMDETPIEQVNQGPKMVEATEDTQKEIKEEECNFKDLSTISTGELRGNDSSKEDNEAKKPEEEVIEGLDIGGADKDTGEVMVEKDVILEHNRTTIQEEAIKDAHEEDKAIEGLEIAGADKDDGEPVIEEYVVPDHSTTTIVDEPTKVGHEEDKVIEGLNIAVVNEEIGDPITKGDVAQDHSMTTIGEETIKCGDEEEKIIEGLEIAKADKELKEPVIDEDVVPDHSITATGEEPVKDGHEEEKIIEELEIVDADKVVRESIIEEDVVPDLSTTTPREEPIKDGHEKNKVIEGLEIDGSDKDIGDPIIEEYVVPDHSTTTIGEESTKDGHEEDKVMTGLDIVGADKDIGESVIGDNVVPDHSTTIVGEEPIQDCQAENKLIEGLEKVDLDKDIGDPITEKDVAPDHSITTIEEEPIKYVHEEDRVIKGLEIVGAAKDIGDPTTGEEVVPDHSTITIRGEPIQDDHEEDKVSEGLKIDCANKDIGEPIIKDVVLDQSTTIIGETPVKDVHEEHQVTEGLERVGADKDIGEPIITENVVPDHPTKTIGGIKDGHEEDKLIEELEIDGRNESIGEPIIEEDGVRDHYTTTIWEEPTKDGHEDKVTEGLEIVDADKNSGKPFIEDDVVPEHSTTTTREEPIRTGQEEDKVIEGLGKVDAEKDIEEDIIEKDVPDHSTTPIGEELIKDVHDEDKVIEGVEIVGSDKDTGEPIIVEDVVQDHSTTTSGEEPIQDGQGEDKVIEGFEIDLTDKEIREPVKEEDVVLDQSTTIGKEPVEDNHGEHEVTEGLELVGVHKDIGEPIIEENVVPDHSTTTIGDIKDGHEEDKVIEGLELAGADKDIGEPITEEDVPDHTTTTIGEEPTKDIHQEDKVIGRLETVGAVKDIGDPIIGEKVVPDHSTTTIRGEPIQDEHEEDQVTEGLKIDGTNKDNGEPIINDVVLDQSTTTIEETPVTDGPEEHKVIEGSERVGADKDIGEPIIKENVVPDHPRKTIGEIKDGHEEDEVIEGLEIDTGNEDIGEPIIEEDGVRYHSTTTTWVEQTKDGHEDKVTDELEIVDADMNSGKPFIVEDIVQDHSKTTSGEELIQDGHGEEKVRENVIEGLEIDHTEKEIGEPIMEEDIVLDQSLTIGEETVQDNHEEHEVTRGLELVGADKDIGEPIIEENVVPDHSTTTIGEIKDGHEEDKVIEGVAGADKDIRGPITEEGVSDHTTTTTGEESTKDVHEEDKVIEGLEIVDADKNSGKPFIEDDVVPGHSTTTTGEEPIQCGQKEYKVIQGLKKVDADNDIGKPIIEKDVVPDHSTTTIGEELINNIDDEDMVIEGSEIVGSDKDTGELVIVEDVQDHSTTSGEEPTQDGPREEKVIEGLHIEKEIGEPIMEEDIVLDQSPTIGEEPVQDNHEEHEVAKGSKLVGTDKDIGEPIIKENVVPDHSTTTIGEINDGHEEDKVIEGVAGADKNIRGPITEEGVSDHTTTTTGGESTKDVHEEDKVFEGLEIVDADKNNGKPFIEGDVVLGHSTTTMGEEPIQCGQVIEGLEKADADNDIGKSIIEKDVVPDHSTTIIGEELINNIHDEDKVIEGLEIVGSDKDTGELVILEDVVQDHSTTTSGEEPIQDGPREEKVIEGLEIDRTDKEIGEPIMADDIILDQSLTTGEEPVQDNHKEHEVNEGSELVGADKDIGEPIIEENVVPDYSTTTIGEINDGHEEDKVIEGVAGADKDIREPITEEGVLDHSTTTTGEEPTKDIHEEDKVTKGLEIVDADKNSGKPFIEDDVVPEHSTTSTGKEPIQNVQEEDKVIEGLERVDSHDDIREPIIEKDVVPNHSTTTIGDELINNVHDKDKVIGRLEIVGSAKDTREPVIVEDVQDYSTTRSGEEPIQDGPGAEKVIKGLEIDRTDKKIGEPIMEEDVVFDQSPTIGEEPVQDNHEEHEVIEGSELVGADKDIGESIIEENVVPDRSTTMIGEINDSHEEDKVIEEVVGADKDIGEPITEEGVSDHTTTTTGEEPTKDVHEEDKVLERLKADAEDEATEKKVLEDEFSQDYEVCMEHATTEAGKDDVENITEDASITQLSTISGREEVTKKNSQEDKMEATEHNGEVEESHLSIDSALEAPDSAQKVETLNLRDEEEQHKNQFANSVTDTTVGETVQEKGSENLSDTSTGLNFEATDMTEKIAMVNAEDVEDLHMSQDADDIKETTEEEIMQKQSSEILDEASSLVPQVSAEQRNKEIIEEEEDTDNSLNNASLEEETEKASLHETKLEGKSSISLLEGLDTAASLNGIQNNACEKERGSTKKLEESFTGETIGTYHLGDHGIQNEEVVLFSDLSSAEQNSKQVNLSEETECLELENLNKHTDVSTTTHQLIEDPIKEESDVISEDKVHEEDGDDPKDVEDNVESFQTSQGQETAISHQKITIDEAKTLIQKSETESMKLERTGESGSIEVKESDLVSLEEATDSTKETEIVTLEEEDPKNSLNDLRATKAPREEITKMKNSDKLKYTSTESAMSEEQVIKEIPEKTESNNHETIFVALPTEKLSLHEAEPQGGELVDVSDDASVEMFSTPIEENGASSQVPDMEDVKQEESSNLDDNATDSTFTDENADAEQEKPEVPVETSAEAKQSVDKDTQTTLVEEITATKPSSDDISEEKPQESSMLISAKKEFDTVGMKEKIKDECLIEDEIIDKKMEAPLVAQTKGEMNMQTEEHLKLEKDSEMGTQNTEQKMSIPESEREELVSEQKDADVSLEREKILELNEFKENSISEISDSDLKQTKFESEEELDACSKELETTSTCADIETDILEKEEGPIKKLDKNIESKTETMKVEEILVEVKSTDHSHKINESHNTTKSAPLEQDNLEAVDPCDEIKRDTESIDHDQSKEALPEIEKSEVVEDKEIMKYQNAVSVEDHTVGESIQEEENENDSLDEAGPKLDAKDQNDDMNDVNPPMKDAIVNKEMPHGVERADESENLEIQSIEEEAVKGVEVLVDNATVEEEKDSDLLSTERNIESTYCNEKPETETLTYVEEINKKVDADPDTEASKEEVLKPEGYENHEKVVTEERSAREAKHDAEKTVEGFSGTTEVQILKMDDTVDTCIKGDSIERMSLDKTSDLVSQLPSVKNANMDQEGVAVEKDVKDIVEDDIPVNHTKEISEEDQKNAEAVIPRENIEPAELQNLQKTLDNEPEENLVGEVGEECKVDSNFESETQNEGAAKGHDTLSVEDGNAQEIFQDKKGDSIKGDKCEVEDDQNKKPNEANETIESETLDDEVPSRHENSSDTENSERRVLGEQEASKDSCRVTCSERSIKESHKEDEKEGDDVNDEATKLVTGEQIPESNAEKVKVHDTHELNKEPKDEISNQEVAGGLRDNGASHNIEKQMITEEGTLKDPNLVALGEESVQKTQQGEEMEGAEVEEESTTLEPENPYSESEGAKDDDWKTNETTKKETVNEMFKSSDVVLVEQDKGQADLYDKSEIVIKDEEDKSSKLDAPPVKSEPSEGPMEVGKQLEEESDFVPSELINETITKESENEGGAPKDATDTDGVIDVNKPADSTFSTNTSTMGKLHIDEELLADKPDASSLTEASQEEKEGKSTGDEENQEVVFVKKATKEMSLPTEESREKIEHEAPVAEMSKEGVKKINEVNIQEKNFRNEEGETQVLKQPDTPRDFKTLDQSCDVTAEKEAFIETDSTKENISIGTIDIPSVPVGVIGKSVQTAEVEEGKHGEAQGNNLELNTAECEADKRMCSLDEETNTTSKSSEAEGASFFVLLNKPKKDIGQAVGQFEEEDNSPSNKEAQTAEIKDEDKTDKMEKDEEGEEEEHKKDDSGSDAPVMVEASRDIDMKPTPKKSHNILSGVGSKVKHSISKVKKAITGKSSHHKQLSQK